MSTLSLKQIRTPDSKPSSIYSPTDPQMVLKSKFWLKYLKDGGQVGDEVSYPQVLRYISHPSLNDWWTKVEGFQAWFLEYADSEHKIEYLADLALDTIRATMRSETAKPGEKLAAAKLALEVSGRIGKAAQKEPTIADEQVSSMTQKQLEEFIRNNLIRIPNLRKELQSSEESDTIDQ